MRARAAIEVDGVGGGEHDHVASLDIDINALDASEVVQRQSHAAGAVVTGHALDREGDAVLGGGGAHRGCRRELHAAPYAGSVVLQPTRCRN